AHMAFPNPDLWHRKLTAFGDHFIAQARLTINADLFYSDALGCEQAFGSNAVRGNSGGIHNNTCHGVYDLTSGKLWLRHSAIPPPRRLTVQPLLPRVRPTLPACWPIVSTTIMVLSRYLSRASNSRATLAWGICPASTI